MAKRYKIHPCVGIARLGASDEWFLGPTTPDVVPDTGKVVDGRMSYRDGSRRLLKQAAGFWVFEYDDANPHAEPALVQLGQGQPVERIEWTVHLANKKAYWFEFRGLQGSDDITNPPGYGYAPTPGSLRNSGITSEPQRRAELVIDFGPRTVEAPGGSASISRATAGQYPITGPRAGILQNAAGPVDIDALASLEGGDDGALAIIPANGLSASINGVGTVDFANNDNWFDNTSDGSVRATVVFADGSRHVADAAWVIVAPPDFAPGVTNVVTLYDVMFDIAVRRLGTRPDMFMGPGAAGPNDFTSSAPPFNDAFEPAYRDDVHPIISRPRLYAWVQARGARPHKWNLDALAQRPFVPIAGHPRPDKIFRRIRRPEDWNDLQDESLMPMLLGDDNTLSRLTLTPTQYHILRQWSRGVFDTTGWSFPPPAPVPDVPFRAARLDRAALEACAGGGFFPGIEIGWIAREAALYVEPFRFRAAPFDVADPLGLNPEAMPNALYPGDVTKRMACPWQADFFDCQGEWWPAQRPDEVVTDPTANPMKREEWARGVSDHSGLVVNWHRLGVVSAVPDMGGVQSETDRDLPEP